MNERCEYNDCGQTPVFATEAVTGTDMKLCQNRFKALFERIVQNAEIVDVTEEEHE